MKTDGNVPKWYSAVAAISTEKAFKQGFFAKLFQNETNAQETCR